MGLLHRLFVRPAVALQDSEKAHGRALRGLRLQCRVPGGRGLLRILYASPKIPSRLMNLDFANPVGLAAGMDKKAECLLEWQHLGFGWIEVGGITLHAQAGNAKPRMFRSGKHRALINRMGFNNPGADTFARALSEWHGRDDWPGHPIGINLGKSKITPLEEAAEDYAFTFCALQELADFFVVNVSSPNTPNLRKLQNKSALDEIL
ncbi:MAG TPA: dihydroorotate dehydrogenase (quinone), partial [Candidatus Poseidoniales archaeon]|nr:dihydroorotate dehydrogenase (quinone) [Candidatus Poseidoniales archaeon]